MQIIGSGLYREVVMLGDGTCEKHEKDTRAKRILGIRLAHYPIRVDALLNFGNMSLNKIEWGNYLRIPDDMRPFVPEMSLVEDARGGCVLRTECIRDYDGNVSRSAKEHGPIDNAYFWKDVETLMEIMDHEDFYLSDIFNREGNNVLVRKISPDVWRPVMIDLKRAGRTIFPFRPELLLRCQKIAKIFERLESFRTNFKR